MYSEKVMEHFRNPKFVGEIADADVIGETGNIRCGDIIRVYLKIKDNVITDIKFKTYGCMAAIAAADVLCEQVKGKTIDEAAKITNKDVLKDMGEVPPIKIHCSVLSATALKDALEKWKEKTGIADD